MLCNASNDVIGWWMPFLHALGVKMATAFIAWNSLALFLCLLGTVQAFYFPGVAPNEFKEGDSIFIKVRYAVNYEWDVWMSVETIGTRWVFITVKSGQFRSLDESISHVWSHWECACVDVGFLIRDSFIDGMWLHTYVCTVKWLPHPTPHSRTLSSVAVKHSLWFWSFSIYGLTVLWGWFHVRQTVQRVYWW